MLTAVGRIAHVAIHVAGAGPRRAKRAPFMEGTQASALESFSAFSSTVNRRENSASGTSPTTRPAILNTAPTPGWWMPSRRSPDFTSGNAAGRPVQRQRLSTQRHDRRLAGHQRDHVAGLAGELVGEPVAVFVHEALARDQAGAGRQGQACAAFAHAQPQAFGAGIAHAQHVDAASIGQHEGEGVALQPG